MNKPIFLTLIALVSICLAAFAFRISVDPETVDASQFLFDVRSRESATVTKAALLKATNATDILPCQTTWLEHPVQELRVTTFEGEKRFRKVGKDLYFTDEQKAMLTALEHNDIFSLKAPCNGPNPDKPDMTEYEMYYSFTVVPEKEASYPGGEETIVDHLRTVSNDFILKAKINGDDLKRGFVVFKVSKTGEVMNAEHMISCGYPSVDDKMVELLNGLPEKWVPAKDGNGQVVEQELVLYFGQMQGC